MPDPKSIDFSQGERGKYADRILVFEFETDARKARIAELRRMMEDWPPPSRAQRVRRWVRRVLLRRQP